MDVDRMGLPSSALSSWTRPCFIRKCIPAMVVASPPPPPLVDEPPPLPRGRRSCPSSDIIVYIVPGGRGASLATSVSPSPLSLTISAALLALRNLRPLIDRHSWPGRSAVPSKADPGTIFSTTTVPVALRKARPTFSDGLDFTTVQESTEGMVNGSRPPPTIIAEEEGGGGAPVVSFSDAPFVGAVIDLSWATVRAVVFGMEEEGGGVDARSVKLSDDRGGGIVSSAADCGRPLRSSDNVIASFRTISALLARSSSDSANGGRHDDDFPISSSLGPAGGCHVTISTSSSSPSSPL
mmetsp:Transcript_20991/g.50607  ORF Transcript_20991/g.50607 Transcript_20991/m.50607 type:complete len:295 (-) Transcript_20991:259-1143(-)